MAFVSIEIGYHHQTLYRRGGREEIAVKKNIYSVVE